MRRAARQLMQGAATLRVRLRLMRESSGKTVLGDEKCFRRKIEVRGYCPDPEAPAGFSIALGQEGPKTVQDMQEQGFVGMVRCLHRIGGRMGEGAVCALVCQAAMRSRAGFWECFHPDDIAAHFAPVDTERRKPGECTANQNQDGRFP